MSKDTIYRQDAIDAVWSLDVELRPSAIDAILNRLNDLPTAESSILTMTIDLDEARLDEIVEKVGQRLVAMEEEE